MLTPVNTSIVLISTALAFSWSMSFQPAYAASSKIPPPSIDGSVLGNDADKRKKEFMAKVKEQLAYVESQMGVLKEKSEVLREKSKEQLQSHLEKLQAQKNQILPELEKAQHSSEAAWEDLKKRIDDLVKDLRKSLDQAATNFF